MESFVDTGPKDEDIVGYIDSIKSTKSTSDKPKRSEDKIISQLPFVASLTASNLIYLLTLVGLHSYNRKKPNRRWRQIVYGTIAGIVSAFFTTPLWVANTRLNVKRRQNPEDDYAKSDIEKPVLKQVTLKGNELLDELVTIAQKEGIGGLWSGINTSVLLAIISSPLQQIIDRLLRQIKTSHLDCPKKTTDSSMSSSLSTTILSSIISRCTTTALTYPLILVQSQQRYTGNKPNQTPVSPVNILKQIIQDRGPLGLYQGIDAKLKQTSIVAGLVALTQPKILFNILNRLLTAIDQNDPEGKRKRRKY